MDYKIISVDSMKGGVGKTTAALNVSALLLEQGFIVLLVDVDITGTNIVYGLDSPFWMGKVHSVSNNNKPINLLNLYQEVFMIGKDLPRWCGNLDYSDKDRLLIKENQINIIGSEIFKPSKKGKEGKAEGINFNPSILFDELHSFWFMEYLKYLCHSFIETAKEINAKKKVAIVIDNSPGFIGINPAVQEWLTDLGPDVGKFLTISSLDKQDLISCGKLIVDLHYKIKHKIIAAKKYSEMLSDKNKTVQTELEDEAERFYIRLISENIDEESKKYYCNKIQLENNRYLESPLLYQAIIINKVPVEIKTKLYTFDSEKIWDAIDGVKTINNLLVDEGTKLFNNIIYYDESINYQFMESSFIKNKNDARNKKSKRIVNLIERFKKYKRGENKKWRRGGRYEYFEEVHREVNSYQEFIYDLVEKLKAFKINTIARLIESEWYPIAPIVTLRQIIDDLLESRELTSSDYEFRNEDITKLAKERRMKLIESIAKGIGEKEGYQSLFNIGIKKSFLDNIYDGSFYSVIYLTITTLDYNSMAVEEIVAYFAFVKSIQKMRLGKAINDLKGKASIVQFLINENMKLNEINQTDYQKTIGNKIDAQIQPTLIELYNAFCHAQARIIDVEEDFHFLTFIIQRTINDSINIQKLFYPNIKDILDRVLIKKTLTHSKAYKEAHKRLVNVNYMYDFQKTLKQIVNNWGIL